MTVFGEIWRNVNEAWMSITGPLMSPEAKARQEADERMRAVVEREINLSPEPVTTYPRDSSEYKANKPKAGRPGVFQPDEGQKIIEELERKKDVLDEMVKSGETSAANAEIIKLDCDEKIDFIEELISESPLSKSQLAGFSTETIQKVVVIGIIIYALTKVL